MTSNFKIRNFIAIEFEGRELDLHNNFSFATYSYDKKADEIKICFNKSKADWVSKNEFHKLTFTLSKIHYVQTIDPNPEIINDDHCLSGITFFYPGDRDDNSGLLNREQPESGDDIIFTFESDRVIRVNCDTVILQTEKLD
ncbi:hypothetical protein BH10BAC1_BH10BAC1_03060 [soil metagenome]